MRNPMQSMYEFATYFDKRTGILNLRDQEISDSTGRLMLVCIFIERNKHAITSIDLINNPINDEELHTLAIYLKYCTRLKSVHLAECQFKNILPLCLLPNSTEEINLSHNSLMEDQIHVFIKFKSLKKLDLSTTGLTDKDAKMFLCSNSIRELNLHNNFISEELKEDLKRFYEGDPLTKFAISKKYHLKEDFPSLKKLSAFSAIKNERDKPALLPEEVYQYLESEKEENRKEVKI